MAASTILKKSFIEWAQEQGYPITENVVRFLFPDSAEWFASRARNAGYNVEIFTQHSEYWKASCYLVIEQQSTNEEPSASHEEFDWPETIDV